MPTLYVDELNHEIDHCNFGEPDRFVRAFRELKGLFDWLGFEPTSKGTVAVPATKGMGTFDAICGLSTAVAARYKPVLNYILQAVRYENVHSVEIKVKYERATFPFDAWCFKVATATQNQIRTAGGLNPRYSTEICFDEEEHWLPMRFIFGIHAKANPTLPLVPAPQQDVPAPSAHSTKGPKIGLMGESFGDRTYYFLVPRGTIAYCRDGRLTGEIAFPQLISLHHIWFVKRGPRDIEKVFWKEGEDSSQLPTPAETAAAIAHHVPFSDIARRDGGHLHMVE